MYENIDFDNIDLTQNPPQEEPDRQYYYIAKARQYVQEKSRWRFLARRRHGKNSKNWSIPAWNLNRIGNRK